MTARSLAGRPFIAEPGPAAVDKPPYRVPSMAEIAATPWNGYQAISTFSGCGGSSLGYRMAGFRVPWANEFVDAARDCYLLNSPATTVDGRDIRTLTAGDVLDATGLQPGELDLMDGSPPCASFSTAGKRQAHWGQVNKYSDVEQRTDDLFYEFIRLVSGLQPKVFVAENVSGLVKGVAKGYFVEIMRAMKKAGYVVASQLLDAQWLGVPQARRRIIFVGVRSDLGVAPAFPKPLPYCYSVRDALPWITQIGTAPPFATWVAAHRDVGTTMVDAGRNPSPTILAAGVNEGASIVDADGGPAFIDSETGESVALGAAIGKEWDSLREGGQSDRYFQLVRLDPERPAGTITAAGGNTGLASVTCPTERRKFTIGELRRICGFPDDFQLTGSYAQRWERMGRAVPPPMMAAVAATIRDEILSKL